MKKKILRNTPKIPIAPFLFSGIFFNVLNAVRTVEKY